MHGYYSRVVYDKGAGDNGMRTVYKIDSYCLFVAVISFSNSMD